MNKYYGSMLKEKKKEKTKKNSRRGKYWYKNASGKYYQLTIELFKHLTAK